MYFFFGLELNAKNVQNVNSVINQALKLAIFRNLFFYKQIVKNNNSALNSAKQVYHVKVANAFLTWSWYQMKNPRAVLKIKFPFKESRSSLKTVQITYNKNSYPC